MTGFMPVPLYQKRLAMFQSDVDHLRPAFQPIVALSRPHHVKGFEALARNQAGATPFNLFGVANLWGRRFKTYLDTHMCRVSLEAFATHGRGDSGTWPYQLSVNCFADSLYGEKFASGFASILDEAGVPGEQLILEISERASLSDAMFDAFGNGDETTESLARYREVLTDFTRRLNVRFALDDFGIERANIIRLTGLKLSYVKIDRAVLYSPSASATFRYVADVLRSQGDYPTIIAEGWEDGCSMTIGDLLNVGCRYIQGFGLGRPNASIANALIEAHERAAKHVGA